MFSESVISKKLHAYMQKNGTLCSLMMQIVRNMSDGNHKKFEELAFMINKRDAYHIVHPSDHKQPLQVELVLNFCIFYIFQCILIAPVCESKCPESNDSNALKEISM